jgi:hypothetical protein
MRFRSETPQLERTVVPRPVASVTATPLDDDLVVCGPAGAQGYILNVTAAEIWRLCDGARDVGAIASELAVTYGIGVDQAVQDVQLCLRDLAEYGLLEFPGATS